MDSSNVKGFFDIKPEEDGLKDNDQRYWVGGGKTSGLVTVNPDNKDQDVNIVAKATNIFTKNGKEKKKLTFWKNSFTVDESAERNFEHEKSFIDSILNNLCPEELQNYEVEVIDRSNETYVHNPTKFEGTGQSLGSSMGQKAVLSSSKKIECNNEKPTTNIRVSFHNGKKAVVKLNNDHTVGDLRSHIEALEPSGKPFELRLTYPAKVLDDMNQLLGDGLVNVSVIQVLQ